MSDTEKSAQAQPNESAEPSFRYNAKLAQGIEEKWQKIWDDEGTFWAANVNGDLKDGKGHNAEGRPSYFAMDMFPYPSGKGLHVGHPLGYLATDVVSRYHRMKGENVLHAMGYDAFGLPAEQYAVQTGQHPRITTEQNIANMRRQLHRMGLSFDNRRSFATIDPGYVRWTQWIFSRIYDAWYDEDATNPSGSRGCARPISTLVEQFESGKRAIPGFEGKAWADLSEAEQADVLNDFRLAYISKSPVNWCPGLGTVLANEEVTAEGKSERGNFPVFQRELRQWSMRITAYGHRLIEDLDTIDWPEKVKLMQRNWIGESHGASVHFDVETPNGVKDMEIYTTRDGEVIFKKYSLIGGLEEFAAQFCDTLSRSTDFSAAVTDRDAVIAIAGAGKKELLGKPVSPALEQVMDQRGLYCGEGVAISDENEQFRAAVAAPILCGGDVLGAVLFLSPDGKPAGETECKLAQTVASFLGKHMES